MDRILILGGTGFIGRHLVVHLVENKLAKYIRVCDKVVFPSLFSSNPAQVLPQIAHLNPKQTEAFQSVNFVQVRLMLSFRER